MGLFFLPGRGRSAQRRESVYGGHFVLRCLEKANAKTLEKKARREEKRRGTIGERFQKHTILEGIPDQFCEDELLYKK